jgi:prephenate dehydrogenase
VGELVIALRDTRVTVVGLGLMGGSLAAALKTNRACREVIGVARRETTVAMALAWGMIDHGTCDLAAGVGSANVVVLATPVRVILAQLAEIGPLLPSGCLLMDLGSTKAQIVAAMNRLPPHVQPLGGHPMCGKETSGLAAAEPDLYQRRVFVLTPLPRTPPTALALGRALAEAVGARPLVLEADQHDRLAAAVSHLPYLLACGLVGMAGQLTQDDALWQLATSGFRDTSRLAASNVTMMLDILLTNQEAVLEAMGACQAQLRHLARLIESGDEEGLRTVLTAIRDSRVNVMRVPCSVHATRNMFPMSEAK